jgi:hypothetical protein
MSNIFILYSIITIINIFWLFSFFIRLPSIVTKNWSTSHSIFQIINLIPRTIGVLQIPMITLYTESAINMKKGINTIFYQGVIFFNLIGILIGLIALPLFLNYFSNSINNIFTKGSFRSLISRNNFIIDDELNLDYRQKSFFTDFKLFKINYFNLFFSNFVASYLTVIAFPACILAGYHMITYRATIISLVSIIYGLATYVTILFIDTKMSVLSDQAFHNLITITDFKLILFDCLKGRIFGIIIAILTLPHISNFIVHAINWYLH